MSTVSAHLLPPMTHPFGACHIQSKALDIRAPDLCAGPPHAVRTDSLASVPALSRVRCSYGPACDYGCTSISSCDTRAGTGKHKEHATAFFLPRIPFLSCFSFNHLQRLYNTSPSLVVLHSSYSAQLARYTVSLLCTYHLSSITKSPKSTALNSQDVSRLCPCCSC